MRFDHQLAALVGVSWVLAGCGEPGGVSRTSAGGAVTPSPSQTASATPSLGGPSGGGGVPGITGAGGSTAAAGNGAPASAGSGAAPPLPTASTPPPVSGAPPTPGGYRVVGNQILDANDQAHIFRGVNRPSFEFNVTGEFAQENVYEGIHNWGANVVRIPINQTYWTTNLANYQATIDRQVGFAKKWGLDVILDLHWHDDVVEQENMARPDAIAFWSAFAARYLADDRVLFELYNEPHDISAEEWRNGSNTWAGMQQLLDAVRATGAPNIAIIGGLRFGFDLSSVGEGFNGTNVAYATHPYDFSDKQPSTWDAAFGNLAQTAPVFMTEFGTDPADNNCSATWENQVMDYATQRGISWVAWAWYPPGTCAFPSLVMDWDGLFPTEKGLAVQQRLQGG